MSPDGDKLIAAMVDAYNSSHGTIEALRIVTALIESGRDGSINTGSSGDELESAVMYLCIARRAIDKAIDAITDFKVGHP